MDLIYNGLVPAFVEITGRDGSPVYFSGTVNPGETINVVGSGPDDEMEDHIEIHVNGVEETELHNHGNVSFGPGTIICDLAITYIECKDSDDPICPVDLSRVVAPDVEDVKLISEIKAEAYPNPFSDRVTIEFNLPDTDRTVLEIVDLNGEIVHAVC